MLLPPHAPLLMLLCCSVVTGHCRAVCSSSGCGTGGVAGPSAPAPLHEPGLDLPGKLQAGVLCNHVTVPSRLKHLLPVYLVALAISTCSRANHQPACHSCNNFLQRLLQQLQSAGNKASWVLRLLYASAREALYHICNSYCCV
jgi:hypothetical protein